MDRTARNLWPKLVHETPGEGCMKNGFSIKFSNPPLSRSEKYLNYDYLGFIRKTEEIFNDFSGKIRNRLTKLETWKAKGSGQIFALTNREIYFPSKNNNREI